MGKYVELDCSSASKGEFSNLLKAIGQNPYGSLEESLVIPLENWRTVKVPILKRSSKYKSVRYGLVDVVNGKPTRLVSPSEVFSEEFLEMERSISSI